MFSSLTRIFTAPVLAVLLLSVLASCQSEIQPAGFYAIDSLVKNQVQLLTHLGAGLRKEAQLDNERDTVQYIPSDTTAWTTELGIFDKLREINKPVNRANYDVKDGLLDQESNLTVKLFQSRKELPIEYLKIYYHRSLDKPRKIEALYRERNLLFSSARLLSMYFQQMNGNIILTSYSVQGGQKMILGDSVEFAVTGKVLID